MNCITCRGGFLRRREVTVVPDLHRSQDHERLLEPTKRQGNSLKGFHEVPPLHFGWRTEIGYKTYRKKDAHHLITGRMGCRALKSPSISKLPEYHRNPPGCSPDPGLWVLYGGAIRLFVRSCRRKREDYNHGRKGKEAAAVLASIVRWHLRNVWHIPQEERIARDSFHHAGRHAAGFWRPRSLTCR